MQVHASTSNEYPGLRGCTFKAPLLIQISLSATLYPTTPSLQSDRWHLVVVSMIIDDNCIYILYIYIYIFDYICGVASFKQGMLLYVVCTPLRYALLIRSDLCLHPSNIGLHLHCPQGLSFTDVQPFCCRCQHLCSVGRCCSDVWICTFLPTSFSYRLRVLAVNCCACMCVLYFTTPWNVRIAFNGFMSGSGILAEIIPLKIETEIHLSAPRCIPQDAWQDENGYSDKIGKCQHIAG